MKLSNALAALAGIALSLAVQARAGTINITVDSSGSLLNDSGVASKTQYEGLNGGLNNNDPASNLAFLNGLISRWNGIPLSPTLGTAIGSAVEPSGFSGSGSTFGFTGITGSFDYVVFHFGNGQAGDSSGGWWQAYYIHGLDVSTLTFNLPMVDNEPIGGISSARFYNGGTTTLADGGMTLILLGAALSGLGLMRRLSKG
jgi:hypothetical protein